jgi:hypothetical protein
MAKKKSETSAMEFEFRAVDLERLLSSKPKKVLFTVWVEVVKTDKGEKVGAMRIKANTEMTSTRGLRDGGTAYGEPKPPGVA